MSIKKRLLFLFLIPFMACRKDQPTPATTTPNNDLSNIFQSFWDQMNTNYLYWDIDSTNWGEIYKNYQPLFAKLDIHKNVDIQSSYSYFQAITKNLVDGHYLINFEKSELSGRFIYPIEARKISGNKFHSPFNYTPVDTGYLDKGFKAGDYVTLDNKRLDIISGSINDSIIYLHCNIFYLKECITNSSQSLAKDAIRFFFNKIQAIAAPKGIIIDVRNNSGGNLEDLSFLVGQFINKPLPIGFSRYKSGTGRLDYTPWIPATIAPSSGGRNLNIPIVVLVDNYTISAAEAVAMAIHCLPKSRVIGELTWGATGPVTDQGIYHSGPFKIPGFLDVYTSSAAFKYIDGKIYEGKGFPPDIPIDVNSKVLANGHDPILESAILYFK